MERVHPKQYSIILYTPCTLYATNYTYVVIACTCTFPEHIHRNTSQVMLHVREICQAKSYEIPHK